MRTEDREKKRAWKANQKRSAQEAFPMSEADLGSMFDFVETSVGKAGCDHSHQFTVDWLVQHAHDVSTVVSWLEETGGYCDCEVVANSYDHFMQNRGDA